MSQTKTFGALDDLLRHELAGRGVLVRVDYNLPLDAAGKIADDTRLRESLETLSALTQQGAKVLILAHLGNPQGADKRYSLRPLVRPLEALLATPITFLPQPVSALTRQDLEALPAGAIALAENLRFTEAEKANDADLAKHLASLGDFYLLDAFSICHRPHASIVGVAKHLPAFAGLALAQEVKTLRTLLGDSQETSAPLKGSLAIVGGAKISTKLPLLNALLRRFERVAVGGGLANTLAAARGFALGRSLIEKEALLVAEEFLETAGNRLLLPNDFVIAKFLVRDLLAKETNKGGWGKTSVVSIESGVPNDQAALDIGSTTIATFTKAIEQAQLIVWNGPLGLFEEPPFDKGTVDLVSALAKSSAQVIAGGGETLLAIQRAQARHQDFTHLSTGGGAFLAWLEGQPLPGLVALQAAFHQSREFGGPTGAEPTRYGDWERKGRAIDF